MTETAVRTGRAPTRLRLWIGIVVALVLGFGVSLGRLVLSNPAAISEVLWAEDGLFPLCVRKANVLSCTVEAYAGYLLFVPRVVAGVVAAFDVTQWAVVANLSAAALVGVCAAGVFAALYARGISAVTSGFSALLMVLVPIAGVEALNVYSTVYTPLLAVSAVALAFPPQRRSGTVAAAVALLVTALTMPSAAVLLVALAYQWARHRISRFQGLTLGAAFIVGLLIQAFVDVTAPDRRSIAISLETLANWAKAIPQALATLVPGLNVGESTDVFGLAALPASAALAWIAVIGAVVAGLLLVRRHRSPTQQGAGLLIISGLLVGAVPSITGYVSNRYFVTPVTLWLMAALLLGSEHLASGQRSWWAKTSAEVASIAVLLVLWWPSLPASPLRATGAPNWSDFLRDVQNACPGQPELPIRFRFTPYDWPPGENVPVATAPCKVIWRS